MGKKGVGFGADLSDASKHDTGVLLAKVLPEDLHTFGMIPEFIGRVPVVAHVEEHSSYHQPAQNKTPTSPPALGRPSRARPSALVWKKRRSASSICGWNWETGD